MLQAVAPAFQVLRLGSVSDKKSVRFWSGRTGRKSRFAFI